MIASTLKMMAGALALSMAVPGPASAQTALTLRDRLLVVSSTSTSRVTDLLARTFAERYADVRAPEVRSMTTTRAMEVFCAGIGPETPDVVVSTRRIPAGMREICGANGVEDIVEIQLGLGAVVLAARRGDPLPQLTSRQIYEAVAAERAGPDGFAPNTAATWAQIAGTLPANQIRVLVPPRGHGTRQLFEDLVLEAGCRNIRDIRLLFEAGFRRSKCVTMREDGRVVQVAGDDIASSLLNAPAGTIGVTTLDEVFRSGGNLIALSLDGVMPTPASVASLDYDQTRTVYLYAKRQHARNQQGVGVVRGIAELLAEATSELAMGPAGYLVNAGLIPLPPAERIAQRRTAERMTTINLR